MIDRLVILIIIALLGACAPTTTTDTTGNNEPVPTREGASADDIEVSGDPGSGFGLGDAGADGGFIAELSGASNESLSGRGVINCENNVYVIRPALDMFPQVSLILPTGATPDNYTLANNQGDGSAASASVFFADGRVFAANVNGIVIINNLATQAGQPVSGSFDFSASSGSQTIDARGEFDFISGEDAIYCS